MGLMDNEMRFDIPGLSGLSSTEDVDDFLTDMEEEVEGLSVDTSELDCFVDEVPFEGEVGFDAPEETEVPDVAPPNEDVGGFLDSFSASLKNGLLGSSEGFLSAASPSEPFDIDAYFKENMLDVEKNPLTDDALVTITMMDGGNRIAKFARLGDLRNYLMSKTK